MKEQKKMEDLIERITEKIFTRRTLKRAFTEEELRELVKDEVFYKSTQLWFTKEMIEADIPRIIKIVSQEIKG